MPKIFCAECGFAATKETARSERPLCWRHDPNHERKPVRRTDRRFKRKAKLGEGARSETVPGRRAVMPASLLDTYDLQIKDRQLIALREDVATTEAMIQETLRSMQAIAGDSPADMLKRDKLKEDFLRFTAEKRRLVAAETDRMMKIGWTPEYVMRMCREVAQILSLLEVERKLSAEEFMRRFSRSQLFSNETLQLVPAVSPDEVTGVGAEDELDALALLAEQIAPGEYEVP